MIMCELLVMSSKSINDSFEKANKALENYSEFPKNIDLAKTVTYKISYVIQALRDEPVPKSGNFAQRILAKKLKKKHYSQYTRAAREIIEKYPIPHKSSMNSEAYHTLEGFNAAAYQTVEALGRISRTQFYSTQTYANSDYLRAKRSDLIKLCCRFGEHIYNGQKDATLSVRMLDAELFYKKEFYCPIDSSFENEQTIDVALESKYETNLN